MLCGSCSSLLLHLCFLLHQMGQCTHSDIALLSSQLSQRDSYEHLQGPEEQVVFAQHMEGDAGAVVAVQPLFLFEREISQQFSVTTWLYVTCLPAKGPGPSPSAGGPTMGSHDNSDNATSDQTAWQFVTIVS